MTVSPLVKAWLFKRYGKAWRRINSTVAENRSKAAPPSHYISWNDFGLYSTILLVDGTMKLKYNNTDTGAAFVKHQLMREILAFLNLQHTGAAYLCIDLVPGQINKQKTQESREKHKAATVACIPVRQINPETKEQFGDVITRLSEIQPHYMLKINEEYIFIGNNIAPTRDQWEGFILNKSLYPELIHYVTSFIFKPDTTGLDATEYKKLGIHIPEGKHFYMWGGNLLPLPSRTTRFNAIDPLVVQRQTMESSVFYLGHAYNNETKQFDLISGRDYQNQFDLNVLQNLKEAELSVLYFLTRHPRENITVLSGDGDLIFLLLLASRDRIDTNGNWLNTVYLRLVVRNSNTNGESMVEEININQLYTDIMRDSKLNTNVGIPDPILFITAINILIKNDFVHQFGCELGNFNPIQGSKRKNGNESDPEDDEDDNENTDKIPTILYTFLQNPGKYKDMIQIMISDGNRGEFKISPIRIDRKIFHLFVYDCYIQKYRIPAAKKFKTKDASTLTLDHIKLYLAKYRFRDPKSEKAKKAQIPSNDMIDVYCCQLTWVLNYWQNSYRQDGSFPADCLLLVNELPVYGYVQASSGGCIGATKVAPANEFVDFYHATNVNKNQQGQIKRFQL